MNPIYRLLLVLLVMGATLRADDKQIPNRLIDYPGFLKVAQQTEAAREARRLTEAEFLQMAQEGATIILDARSSEKFRLMHVKGAKNLSLSDITEAELAKIIPSKTSSVLIYCNNNFTNSPAAFPGKAATASLNIYTYNTLRSYGYTNVFELGPLLDINKTKLPLEGTDQKAGRRK
jgi:phage shock protein E